VGKEGHKINTRGENKEKRSQKQKRNVKGKKGKVPARKKCGEGDPRLTVEVGRGGVEGKRVKKGGPGTGLGGGDGRTCPFN